MSKWVQKNIKGDFEGIASKFGISQVLARLLINRSVNTEEEIDKFLNGTVKDLISPLEIKGMAQAVEIINEAILDDAKIRIIGDYDIDGICATYIMVATLKALGADVSYAIPHRVVDGYGLSMRLTEECIKDNIDLIITVDNGISAVDTIYKAKDAGIKVIVTDHHQIPNECPTCDVIVNPHMDKEYEFPNICGAFVAFKLSSALIADNNEDLNLIEELIPFAAFATVGDIMPLIGENRIIVQKGLDLISKTNNVGLSQLIKVCGIADYNINTYHLGFILGPCINASGRLDDATLSLELFLTTDKDEANEIANKLHNYNLLRQDITAKNVDKAIEEISNEKLPKVIVKLLDDCPESVAGIVAGRIREHFNRPTLILTRGKDLIKMSGRSIEAYNLFEEINKYRDLFVSVGGHKGAAGGSLHIENVDILNSNLNESCTLQESDFEDKIVLDMKLPFKYLCVKLIEDINKLSPFGPENTKPLFGENDVNVISSKIVGKNKNALKLLLEKDGIKVDAIYFGKVEEFENYIKTHDNLITIAFCPSINSFRGVDTIQLEIKYFK